jgi:hypothetical protein
VQAGVQKLKGQLKTLLRENNGLKLELESKLASNETRYPSEDDPESRDTRIRELENTVKTLEKVNPSPIIVITTKTFLFDQENSKQKRRIKKVPTSSLQVLITLLDARLHKYKAKQLRTEAEDLLVKNSEAKRHEDVETDPEYRMRKVSSSIL